MDGQAQMCRIPSPWVKSSEGRQRDALSFIVDVILNWSLILDSPGYGYHSAFISVGHHDRKKKEEAKWISKKQS
jgi:hypothetical protein